MSDRLRAPIVFIVACIGWGASVSAQSSISVDQQNVLVRRYCAVCHNDRTRNGGLNLQRFNGATVAPSLAAMMLSKLTGGLPLEIVARSSSDPSAKAQLSRQLREGAILAAGVAPPDPDTTFLLALMFAAQSNGATVWQADGNADSGSAMSVRSASVLREVRRRPDMAESYRLVLTCDAASREGSVQLAWSPEPRVGAFTTTVDGRPYGPYSVEGKERMGNGVGASSGLAAYLVPTVSLPLSSLKVHDLFPGETVDIGFDDLPVPVRRSMSSCFPER